MYRDHNSSYRDQKKKEIRAAVGTYLTFIDDRYGLKVFLDELNCDQAHQLIRVYAESRRICNHRVKTPLQQHSAASAVQKMYHFVLVGLRPWTKHFACQLNKGVILQTIPNRRLAASGTRNREFTDDEVKAILGVCKHCPRETCLITILREIGLRLSAICHLQYGNVVLDTEIREVCRVKEKHSTWREFVTGENLQCVLRAHMDALPEPYHQPTAYIFNSQTPTLPACRSSMANLLKRIGRDAQIKTPMHAHAFRYTIVGRLISEGNPVALVSKFMGHRSIQTTERHYFVTTLQRIHENMNNPFTGTYRRKTKPTLTERKLQRCQRLLDTYHRALQEATKQKESAVQVVERIRKHLLKGHH
jgi:integrase